MNTKLKRLINAHKCMLFMKVRKVLSVLGSRRKVVLTSPILRATLTSPSVDLANKLLASSKILKSTMAPLTFFQMKR